MFEDTSEQKEFKYVMKAVNVLSLVGHKVVSKLKDVKAFQKILGETKDWTEEEWREFCFSKYMDGKEFTKNVSRGAVSIWKWLPIIWQDRNYDWSYLLRVIDKKLELMSESIIDSPISEREEVAKSIVDARKMIDELLNGTFENSPEHHDFKSRYPNYDIFVEYTTKDKEFELRLDDDEEATQEYLNAVDKYENRRKELKKQLFDHLNENLSNWWY